MVMDLFWRRIHGMLFIRMKKNVQHNNIVPELAAEEELVTLTQQGLDVIELLFRGRRWDTIVEGDSLGTPIRQLLRIGR